MVTILISTPFRGATLIKGGVLIRVRYFLPRNLAQDFWQVANGVLNKDKFAITPLFNNPKVLPSASDKVNLFVKNFSKIFKLDDSGTSLPVFPSRTNVKLHNFSLTPKMIKKVNTNFDSSKACGPNCILARLLNMCLKESCFPDCWKVSLVVPVFKKAGKRSTAENYCPVSLLFVVSKVF